MPAQEESLLPKVLCASAHPVRAIRYQVVSQNDYRIAAAPATIPVSTGDKRVAQDKCLEAQPPHCPVTEMVRVLNRSYGSGRLKLGQVGRNNCPDPIGDRSDRVCRVVLVGMCDSLQ